MNDRNNRDWSLADLVMVLLVVLFIVFALAFRSDAGAAPAAIAVGHVAGGVEVRWTVPTSANVWTLTRCTPGASCELVAHGEGGGPQRVVDTERDRWLMVFGRSFYQVGAFKRDDAGGLQILGYQNSGPVPLFRVALPRLAK